MDRQEIMDTPIWGLFEKGRNYQRMVGIPEDTDKNYRFYNGDQWGGAKLGGVEPVQQNFIKPIVKYKVAVIHDNLYGVVFDSMNFENPSFRPTAEKYCKLLNNYIARIWEQDKMDFKLRRVTKDSAINDEGIIYIWYDAENNKPVHEVIKKNDIFYGNENDDDIQNQPYILIRKRMPVVNAIDLALREGLNKAQTDLIVGDMDNFEESGEAAKLELEPMVTVVYKFYRKADGVVYFACATRWVTICDNVSIGLKLYPVAHMNWEEKEGSARGEGEVRYHIPNQIEVNKIAIRRVLTVKDQSYPTRIVDTSKIANPDALNQVGITIETNGAPVDDVNKIIGIIQPAQMSADVKLLFDDLINVSRDLAGAGDTATGEVDPESASGRAILAVQQASRAPMTEQKETFKAFVEDIAKIDLEMLVVNAENGINMEEEVTDSVTGEKTFEMVNIPQIALEQLKASVKIDVTPKSPYDRFAQEQTLENLFMNGLFNVQRLPELEVYVNALPDDSVAPKQVLLDAIKRMRESQTRIAQIQAEAQIMQQKAQQFLMGDPDQQAGQISDAQMRILMQQLQQQEQGYAEQEAELDEQVEVPEEE